MNTLSWFLYFANVVSNIHDFLVVMLIVSIPSLLLWYLAVAISRTEPYISQPNWPHIKWPIILVFVGCLNSLIPSQNTMYAIAASELGEEVIKSNIGQKSIKALEMWIDSQLNKVKK